MKQFDRLEQFGKLAAPSEPGVGANDARSRTGFRTQALPHGPKPPSQWQQNVTANANNTNAFQSQAPTPAVPPAFSPQQSLNGLGLTPQGAATSTLAAAGGDRPGRTIGGPEEAQKQAQELDTLAAQRRSDIVLQPSRATSGAEVARAKPAEVANSNAPKPEAADAYALSPANGTNFSQSATLAAETARWSINAAGGLQRSVDQGKTWQDVDINTAPPPASTNLQFAMKSSREKTLSKDKADAKEAPAVFRAVSANGPDVWAGGSGGTLYHSTDAGAHWLRVVPSWSGVMLTEDIVSLQFADPQRGRILTSSSEIWTTVDAGQTWQKH